MSSSSSDFFRQFASSVVAHLNSPAHHS